MENEEKFLEFVGTASERAGALTGKVATIGGKIAGFASGSVSAGKDVLGLADKKVKRTSEKKSDNTKTSTLKSDLAAARRKLAKTEKTQSKLKLQLKELKTENQSLVSELDQIRGELSETKSREGVVRARAAALESELDDTRGELEKIQSKSSQTDNLQDDQSEEVAALKSDLAAAQSKLDKMRNEAKKTKSHFESRFKEMQEEKDTLLSELEKAQSQVKEAETSQDDVNVRVTTLESKLAKTQENLKEAKNETKKVRLEFESQVKTLQAENDSLISELEEARKEADDAIMKADSMKSKIVALESDVNAFDLKLRETHEENSDIGIVQSQTSSDSSDENQPVESLVAEQQLSVPVDTTVGKVEEPKQEPSLDAEPESTPEVEVTEPVEVTLEDVRSADFKNEAQRIIFMKAFSDFAGENAITRTNAAGALAGIHHELSFRLLVTHIEGEPSAMVRRECIKALTTLEMVEGLSVIERALADEAASVRLAAVWGVYRLAGTKGIPKLIGMLSDNDESVRRRAVTCIGWLGGQLETVGNFGSCRTMSALMECLNDPAKSTRRISLEHSIERWQKWWKAELLG